MNIPHMHVHNFGFEVASLQMQTMRCKTIPTTISVLELEDNSRIVVVVFEAKRQSYHLQQVPAIVCKLCRYLPVKRPVELDSRWKIRRRLRLPLYLFCPRLFECGQCPLIVVGSRDDVWMHRVPSLRANIPWAIWLSSLLLLDRLQVLVQTRKAGSRDLSSLRCNFFVSAALSVVELPPQHVPAAMENMISWQILKEDMEPCLSRTCRNCVHP
jgi:hypothetical protein